MGQSVTLVEIEWDGGKELYSFEGVSTLEGWYKGKVRRITPVTREITHLPAPQERQTPKHRRPICRSLDQQQLPAHKCC